MKEAVITGVPMLVFMATNFVKALGLNTIIMNQIGEDGMAKRKPSTVDKDAPVTPSGVNLRNM